MVEEGGRPVVTSSPSEASRFAGEGVLPQLGLTLTC